MATRESTGHLIGYRGMKLFYRTWIPKQPLGSILLIHGANEHSGRYDHVGEYFSRQGLAVYGLDLRGHGQSEGSRWHVDSFVEYLEDLRAFVGLAREYGKPIVVGHGLGGLITFHYGVMYPESISALVLSSPWFKLKTQTSAAGKVLMTFCSVVFPKLQRPSIIESEYLSRDPEVNRQWVSDSLVGDKVTYKWLNECLAAAAESRKGMAAGLKLPVLFLQAGDDLVVDPQAALSVYEQVPGEKKFNIYPGKYHELFNAPEKEEILGEVIGWLQEHELFAET